MSRLVSLVLAAAVLATSAGATLAAPTAPALSPNAPLSKDGAVQPPPFVADRVIVRWRDGTKGAAQAAERGLSRVAALDLPDRAIEVLDTHGRPVEEVVAQLANDPNVAWAEPDYVIQLPEHEMQEAAAGTTTGELTGVAVNDPLTSGQYSLDRMAVRDAWSLERGASNVIAVLDTGIQYTHPDLAGRIVAGYDFVNDDADPRDDNRHGTWVAGIIAANANDGKGVAGVSWSDKIMPMKIMDANGTGTDSDLGFGIRWAVDHGATIINMSVGGYPGSNFVREQVEYAWSKNVVLIGAAGNNRRDELFYPASYPNVVSVSATQIDDEFANWSSYGSAVDVSAPGDAVLTTDCGGCSPSATGSPGYAHISGTSFATPNVAGVVALIRAKHPSWTNQQVVDHLIATADDLGYAGWDKRYGHGRVNAFRAVGGNPPRPAIAAGDGHESNNGLARARVIGFGTIHPSIHPAGDVDFFAIDAPRAGRIDVAVTAITDVRPFPWQKGSLFIDPVLRIYSSSGTVIQTVDDPYDSSTTERASVQFNAAGRIFIRVDNWAPNGNPKSYSITTSFVDNVAPAVVHASPAKDASGVVFSVASVKFSEAVTGVSGSTFTLRESGGAQLPAEVAYDGASRTATLRPLAPMKPSTSYTLSLSSAIRDVAGLSMAAQSWSFTVGTGLGRLAGADRYATAAAASAWHFAPGVPVAYLATGRNFPDALAAAPAAARNGGPILLVTGTEIPAATAAELTRLKPQRIVILGGSGVVTDGVLAAAASFTSGAVTRIAGADRYATAAEISRSSFPTATTVYLATGANYPDALAGGPLAARDGAPILLARSDGLPAATAAELDRLRPHRVVLLGGEGVLSPAVAAAAAGYTTGGGVVRLAGADRYATAAAIAAYGYPSARPLAFVSTGVNFADALAAAPAAGRAGAPLLLVRPDALPAPASAQIDRLAPRQVVALGGSGAVAHAVIDAIAAVLR